MVFITSSPLLFSYLLNLVENSLVLFSTEEVAAQRKSDLLWALSRHQCEKEETICMSASAHQHLVLKEYWVKFKTWLFYFYSHTSVFWADTFEVFWCCISVFSYKGTSLSKMPTVCEIRVPPSWLCIQRLVYGITLYFVV